MMPIQRYQADGLLLLVAAIWGTTFVAVKVAVADMPPFTFNALRFAIAFLSLLVFYPRFRDEISIKSLGYSLFTGLFLFGGYSLQTAGLQYTSASNAAFITGLSVVMVPAFAAIMHRSRPSWQLMLGILCATIGLATLTLANPVDISAIYTTTTGIVINPGDLLVLAGAACFALHIIMIDLYTKRINTFLFVTGQVASVAFISSIIGWAAEGLPLTITTGVAVALLVTAIPATTIAFLLQNWAQKHTNPANTAIVLATEPVFALAFAFLILHEPIGGQELIGAALMLAGMLIAELGGPASPPPTLNTHQTPKKPEGMHAHQKTDRQQRII